MLMHLNCRYSKYELFGILAQYTLIQLEWGFLLVELQI